ncbi:LysR family transcriptional regulator [Ktedonosporobacter rubrisoli]|uniref:LysR family transcriptional regulator n=1 Tax=Ktedonosporobacter rubrisoli TaxID=2509675 RepID=A0A4V0Z077_KTERU|nr:LysR family transcriptional regulator [Ktedonosporobacter rubrisoli]QBD82261.1 LysR family transcriptional regulator [Ktedonosporobacter rubrisoli]
MEIRQLITFRMIARTLSFSRTATLLNYVQSSVTAQIQALEEELGVPLFDRLGKRIALTDAGKRLLVYAEKIVDLADEARIVASSEEVPSGTLTMSAPETLCAYRLPAVLRLFRERYPQVKLIFRPMPTSDLKRVVYEGDIDIVFAIDELVHSASLVVEPLLAEPLLLLVASDHPLARQPFVKVQDLQGEPFLLTEAGCSYRSVFERALHEAGIHLTTNLEFSSVEAIKQCVMASMGITFLPKVTVEAELAQGRLQPLVWENYEFHVYSQMLWHKEKWISPALQAFLNVVREVLKEPALEKALSQ